MSSRRLQRFPGTHFTLGTDAYLVRKCARAGGPAGVRRPCAVMSPFYGAAVTVATVDQAEVPTMLVARILKYHTCRVMLLVV